LWQVGRHLEQSIAVKFSKPRVPFGGLKIRSSTAKKKKHAIE